MIKSLHLWVINIRECVTVAKKIRTGLPKSMRLTPTISRVHVAIEVSPTRSARMHDSKEINYLNDRKVRRILHFDIIYYRTKV